MGTPRGEKAKKAGMTLLQLQVQRALKDKLAKVARDEDLSTSQLVRRVLSDWLSERAA